MSEARGGLFGRLPVNHRMLAYMMLIGVGASVFAAAVSGVVGFRERLKLLEANGISLVSVLAASLDADALDRIRTEADRQTRSYRQIERRLAATANLRDDLASIYVLRPTAEAGRYRVIAQLSVSPEAPGLAIGSPVEISRDVAERVLNAPVTLLHELPGGWSWRLSAVAAARDPFGEALGLVVIDYRGQAIDALRRNLARVVGLAVLLFGILWWGQASLIARSYGIPIREIHDTIVANEAGDVTRRIPVPAQRELAYVARAVNDMLDGWSLGASTGSAAHAAISPGDRELTVLYTDMIGFAQVGSGEAAASRLEILEQCFEVIDSVASQYQGRFVDQYCDRAILLFGLGPDGEGPSLAVDAALAIQDAIAGLRVELELPDLRIGIGLDTGRLLVGPIRSAGQRRLAAVGMAVENAQAIEAFTRAQGTGVMITAQTRASLGDEYELERLESVLIPRSGELITAFKVRGRKTVA